MSKYIKIVGNITEKISIGNSATSLVKNTDSLKKDNQKFIQILDYWTNLFERHFEIPNSEYDMKGVDLIYNSPLKDEKIYLDIKTQTNITTSLNLYLREFSKDKLENRNYIIFNKKNTNTIFGKIYYIDSLFIKELKNNDIFLDFLNKLKSFEGLTQNFIKKDENLDKKFIEINEKFNNKEILIEDTKIIIKFLNPRKDRLGIVGNTNFLENIKLEIETKQKSGN